MSHYALKIGGGGAVGRECIGRIDDYVGIRNDVFSICASLEKTRGLNCSNGQSTAQRAQIGSGTSDHDGHLIIRGIVDFVGGFEWQEFELCTRNSVPGRDG